MTERDAGANGDGVDGTATVLVVEDETPLAALYERWLSDAYRVRVANTGGDALDRFDGAVDVVLLDRRLPDRPGSEVLERIRGHDSDCQVAMVTAVEPDEDVLEMGFDD
ncbi:MAG: response regulator [Halobacterium sp.]